MSPIPRPRPLRRLNLRALLAGGTTTTALIAPSVIAFLSLAVYVGFDGVPFGAADDGDRAAIPLGAPGSHAADSQASGSGPGSSAGTVAARIPAAAAAPSRVGGDGAGGPGGGAPGGDSPAGAGTPSPGAPGTAPGPGSAQPGAPAPGGPGTGGESPRVPAAPSGPGSGGSSPPATGGGGGSGGGGLLGDTVSNLEQATDPIVDLPLSETTSGLTDKLDETVNGALNGVGGLLGNPKLGDQVGNGLGKVTDGLLGKGGLTDKLLP